ncbi:hypothetical protein MPUL_52680 [Mycolicibacterium pulveris]|uniref:Uncharacterized protein n=1 Tax=Mycolicibacterium pulveris TaxID=36813 RepID=A0A7I7UT35_MYCPV|nr:hypothetical protein MPUL_52680 [Mycolicibacterium pulveris]
MERSTTSSTVKSVRPVSPRIASADFMKRLERDSGSTAASAVDAGRAAPAERPVLFAMVDNPPGARGDCW